MTITEVDLGTAASSAGLRRDDVILAVNQRPVSGVGEFVEFMKELDDEPAVLSVKNDGGGVRSIIIGVGEGAR